MRFDIALRVNQRGEVGIMRTDKRLCGHTLGRPILSVLEEVEQDNIKRTGSWHIAWKRQMGYHVGRVLSMPATADVAGSWILKVGVHSASLVALQEEIDPKTLVKMHLGLDQGRSWLLIRAIALIRVPPQMAGGGIARIHPRPATLWIARRLYAIRGRGCSQVVKGGMVLAGVGRWYRRVAWVMGEREG